MSLADQVLAVNNDLPIRTDKPIHSGKVRSVYWLTQDDSKRLIQEKGYVGVAPDAPLAVMVISDRISAFDCIWHGENGLNGVPGKGASLNAISNHWFKLFKENGLADSHILDVPHPFVWVVQKAKPVMIEAIARQYITGSMWRSYAKGAREICGIDLPNDLKRDSKLPELLITPSTKGVMKGIPGVPEEDDVDVTRKSIEDNYQAFNFSKPEDIDLYEKLLRDGFGLISKEVEAIEQIFVDTKFEFGYVCDEFGKEKLIYMDEVGTPDSSRYWDYKQYSDEGKVVENSKEAFRQFLLSHFPDSDILVNKTRMEERSALARNNALPVKALQDLSKTYMEIAERITGQPVPLSNNPKQEIIDILDQKYGIIDLKLVN
mmetsp:Transcript_26342/g.39905  ORF Transcript_26342/g.39905 Transcript_26342/m.39905 type:complete len:375 (+) Transcript_26342:121-1245(+)|eukprot:CAMPEP_0178926360 /NCGR_PEP_ID=MMETSP0786-20121207/18486_1 /TAXON_ID=186022 /ORGANISM="Thalassionema frauenfeldii, Strain CCMP 1798" /LENGTH=374 /DNA_ID=CAMNT_0020601467 /DNA_START=26 /DNA_END=1150 /DNA_ORIENTATION=+